MACSDVNKSTPPFLTEKPNLLDEFLSTSLDLRNSYDAFEFLMMLLHILMMPLCNQRMNIMNMFLNYVQCIWKKCNRYFLLEA